MDPRLTRRAASALRFLSFCLFFSLLVEGLVLDRRRMASVATQSPRLPLSPTQIRIFDIFFMIRENNAWFEYRRFGHYYYAVQNA